MKKCLLILLLLLLCLALCACGKKEHQITAYVDESLSDAEAKALGTKINQLPEVQQTQFISRESALESFIGDMEDASAFSGIGATYLRHRYEITVLTSDIDAVVAQLEAIPGIVKVTYHSDSLLFSLWLQKLITGK